MLATFRPDSEFYIDEDRYIVEMQNSDANPQCSIARARLCRLCDKAAFVARYC